MLLHFFGQDNDHETLRKGKSTPHCVNSPADCANLPFEIFKCKYQRKHQRKCVKSSKYYYYSIICLGFFRTYKKHKYKQSSYNIHPSLPGDWRAQTKKRQKGTTM